jgi:hypothetical protein
LLAIEAADANARIMAATTLEIVWRAAAAQRLACSR